MAWDIAYRPKIEADVDVAEANWLTQSSAAGVQSAIDFRQFATRAQLMSYLQSVAGPGGGVNWAFTPSSFNDSRRYNDPVPAGTQEKLGLVSDVFVSGGKSVRLRFLATESPNEQGPIFELPIPEPTPQYYVRYIVRPFGPAITHDFNAGTSRKILFLNQLEFESGQILMTLYQDSGPWLSGYRVTGSGTREFLNFFDNSPYGDNWQLYTAYDVGGSASTQSQWDHRYGPSRSSRDPNDSDFAVVPRLKTDQFSVITAYIDQNWIGSQSRGMIKFWLSDLWSPPELVQMIYRDCALRDPNQFLAESVRPVFRPENALSFPGVDFGLYVDSVIISNQPIAHPSLNDPQGYPLPYPGQEIPSWMPIAGTVDN